MQGVIEIIVRMLMKEFPAVLAEEMEVPIIARIEERPPATGIYPARPGHNRVDCDNQVSPIQESLREVPSHKTRRAGD
jgi:hypothetical protein